MREIRDTIEALLFHRVSSPDALQALKPLAPGFSEYGREFKRLEESYEKGFLTESDLRTALIVLFQDVLRG
ncbi:MAG: hypothetical protein Q8O76_04725 [Chloroflexota bacterium]|nr:hypothetical protein [Chloroflexota bacterium]